MWNGKTSALLIIILVIRLTVTTAVIELHDVIRAEFASHNKLRFCTTIYNLDMYVHCSCSGFCMYTGNTADFTATNRPAVCVIERRSALLCSL